MHTESISQNKCIKVFWREFTSIQRRITTCTSLSHSSSRAQNTATAHIMPDIILTEEQQERVVMPPLVDAMASRPSSPIKKSNAH